MRKVREKVGILERKNYIPARSAAGCAARRVAKNCHGRKNSTDRTDAGVERGRRGFAGASRFASAKGAGAIASAQAPAGTDRKTKARTGRAEPAPGRTRARSRRDDGQTDALARDFGTRSLRFAKEARANSRDAGEFRTASGLARIHRSKTMEPDRSAQGVESLAQRGG